MRRLKIFTWHVHGNYLWYLSQLDHDFYIPLRADGAAGYGGRGRSFPFGDNVRELPAEAVASRQFDCILFQHRSNYEADQFDILSPTQRELPRIYLEHDPPQQHPTNTLHWVDDANVLLVHVTPFNSLMWDSGRSPTRVIEHGVIDQPEVRYTGELARGIAVVNNLAARGRRLGADVFQSVRRDVPLDLVGMGSQVLGGLGEVPPLKLRALESKYRFFFNPIRYTSLGLAVIEAMMIGMPIIGLATTEMATAVQQGLSGFVDTRLDNLVAAMRQLLGDPAEARRLGQNARRYALERFNIERFIRDWRQAFADVTGASRQRPSLTTTMEK
ncbi:MAG: glycosyltransferase family 4 protein [Pirellulales bacterium]|nr:glycosyltransferase family 4 protein [Pirellulales bacterium]